MTNGSWLYHPACGGKVDDPWKRCRSWAKRRSHSPQSLNWCCLFCARLQLSWQSSHVPHHSSSLSSLGNLSDSRIAFSSFRLPPLPQGQICHDTQASEIVQNWKIQKANDDVSCSKFISETDGECEAFLFFFLGCIPHIELNHFDVTAEMWRLGEEKRGG